MNKTCNDVCGTKSHNEPVKTMPGPITGVNDIPETMPGPVRPGYGYPNGYPENGPNNDPNGNNPNYIPPINDINNPVKYLSSMYDIIQDLSKELFTLILKKTVQIDNRINNSKITSYDYKLISTSIGWNDEVISTYRINNRKSGIEIENSGNNNCECCKYSQVLEFNSENKNLVNYILSGKHIKNNICNLKYQHVARQLQNIGLNILEYLLADPEINIIDKTILDVKRLMMLLNELNGLLTAIYQNNQDRFYDYINMVEIVNHIDSSDIYSLIDLISELSTTNWENFTERKKKFYVEKFGIEYINVFLNNNLINYLLSTENYIYIIGTSYLYPVMKMLFVVFGYDQIRRNFINDNKFINDTFFDYEVNVRLNIFNNMYPILTGIMGGVEIDNTPIDCKYVKKNYNGIYTIQDYLWHYDEYCKCISRILSIKKACRQCKRKKIENIKKYLKCV